MKKLTTRQSALNGVVAGLYAAITILTASFAYVPGEAARTELTVTFTCAGAFDVSYQGRLIIEK